MPIKPIFPSPDQREVGTTYSYSISSSGGGSLVERTGTVTGASQTVNGINVSGLNDGTLTLSVSLVDTAGNTGTTATDTVLKDIVAPTGYSVAINQAYINNTNKTALSFTFTGAEVGADYTYSVTSAVAGPRLTVVAQ